MLDFGAVGLLRADDLQRQARRRVLEQAEMRLVDIPQSTFGQSLKNARTRLLVGQAQQSADIRGFLDAGNSLRAGA